MSDLINTLESPGEFDAMTMIQSGEPYFLLLGRDRLAPSRVRDWAVANRERAHREHDAGIIDDEKRDRELRKSTQAEAISWAMEEFKAGDMVRKVKEEPTVKPTYSGATVPEETKRRDAIHSARLAASSALNNAVAALNDLLELVPSSSSHFELDDLRPRILAHHDAMKDLAEDLIPARPIGGGQ